MEKLKKLVNSNAKEAGHQRKMFKYLSLVTAGSADAEATGSPPRSVEQKVKSEHGSDYHQQKNPANSGFFKRYLVNSAIAQGINFDEMLW